MPVSTYQTNRSYDAIYQGMFNAKLKPDNKKAPQLNYSALVRNSSYMPYSIKGSVGPPQYFDILASISISCSTNS